MNYLSDRMAHFQKEIINLVYFVDTTAQSLVTTDQSICNEASENPERLPLEESLKPAVSFQRLSSPSKHGRKKSCPIAF